MSEMGLKAGAGRAKIDLAGVLPHDGFTAERHGLCARALMLEMAGTRACILTLELTSIAPNLQDKLVSAVERACGLTPPYVWIVPTHTFSAPHVRTPGHLKSDEERERNTRYLNAIVSAAERAVTEAVAALAPAQLERACGACPVNVNRDIETPAGWWLGANEDGFADHAMPILRVTSTAGETVAVLAAADVQSSVLDKSTTSEGERVITGDLFGFAAGMVERELGGVCLMLPGAAGDQAPRERAVTVTFAADGTASTEDAHEEGYRILHRQGSALGRAITGALAEAVPCVPGAPEAREVDVELPAQERADFHSLRPRTSYTFEPAGTVRTQVSFLRLGELTLVGVKPEVASSFGSAVRNAAPGRVLFATLVNGGAKYLPAPDAYQKITYEAMNSGFAQGAHEVLLDTILAALDAAPTERSAQ